MKKIGIYGGSFDPVHEEHKKMAIAAIKEFQLDKLYVVPAKLPPHKPAGTVASSLDRLNMLKLAFKDVLGVEISDFEINSDTVSYSYLTVEHFKRLFPNAKLYFLVGTDMLANFSEWKNPEKILSTCEIILTPRMAEAKKTALDVFESHFHKKPAVSSFVGQAVSSTKARNYLALGLKTDFIDQKVVEYIKNKGLYKKDYADYIKSVLPECRLIHTANVMTLAAKYAKKLGLNVPQAEDAALLHDAAKYLNAEDYPQFKLPEALPEPVIHQFLGAFIAENVLKIEDKAIINAIRYHSTGRPDMTQLEKVVFLADLLEEGRAYENVETLREFVDKNFEKGFNYCVDQLYQHLVKSGKPIYHLTKDCYSFYCS